MVNNKLIDCFPYFNERELLEFRIKLLYDKVDKFVITEANQTHSGLQKNYNAIDVIRNIDDPQNKIQLFQLDYSKYDQDNSYTNEQRESLQRDVVVEILDQFDDDCLFHFSDCDEILNPEHIDWICLIARKNTYPILRLNLAFLNCRADLRVFNNEDEPIDWNSSFVCTKTHLNTYTPTYLRLIPTTFRGIIEDKFGSVTMTFNGSPVILGWHFSWMGDNKRKYIKLKSYLNSNDFDLKYFQKNMEDYSPKPGSKDPLNRENHILRPYDLELLPDLIFKDEKFKNFFLPNQ
jgi:hypothetical protein